MRFFLKKNNTCFLYSQGNAYLLFDGHPQRYPHRQSQQYADRITLRYAYGYSIWLSDSQRFSHWHHDGHPKQSLFVQVWRERNQNNVQVSHNRKTIVNTKNCE